MTESLTYHDGDKRFLELLVQHLCADINARQPAAIAWVTVVPANSILQPTHLFQGQTVRNTIKINSESYCVLLTA